MKKFITFLCIFAAFLIMPVFVFAQDAGTDLVDLIANSDLKSYFGSVGALAVLVCAITAFVVKYLKLNSDLLKQVISWIIGIALCFLGWFLHLGIFVGIEWWLVIIYGFAAGLTSNGAYKALKSFLKLFGINV